MKPEQLKIIQERAEKATPAPWKSDGKIVGWWGGEKPGVAVRYESAPGIARQSINGGHWHEIKTESFDCVCMVSDMTIPEPACSGSLRPIEDADFIAASRQDIPDLLIYVAELESERSQALAERDALRFAGAKVAAVLRKYQARYHGAEHAAKHWEEGEQALKLWGELPPVKPDAELAKLRQIDDLADSMAATLEQFIADGYIVGPIESVAKYRALKEGTERQPQ